MSQPHTSKNRVMELWSAALASRHKRRGTLLILLILLIASGGVGAGWKSLRRSSSASLPVAPALALQSSSSLAASSPAKEYIYAGGRLLATEEPASGTTPPAEGTGTILREYWTGIGGSAVADLTTHTRYPNSPTGTTQQTSFEAPTNWADDYGTRMRGLLHPPTTGSYTFWIASDDYSELWLSTDADPANKRLIAQVPGWTASREWTKYPQQQSGAVMLTSGQQYYIEALQKEGVGGDNLAVAWAMPGGAQEVIRGDYLSPPVAAPSTNLALGKPARQSSNYDSHTPASRAVDGNTVGTHAAGTISHTANEQQAWWEVDLGGNHSLSEIKVWNRSDCCTFFTSDFYVLVSESPFNSTDLQTTLGQPGIISYHVAGEAGAPTSLAVNRTGRYVRVQLRGTNYLTMSEVEVWGAASATNLALGRAANQSSTYDSNTLASRATDGNTSGTHAAGTISHTNSEPQAWWQVDLGSSRSLTNIEVWNRSDCCTSFTSNFYVLVSDSPFTSTDLGVTLNQTGVRSYYVGGEAGAPTEVTVGGTGRYIRVQLAGTNYLTLSEVAVWGR